MAYHTMLFPGVQHSDSVILYITKWSVTMLSLVTICHHAKCYLVIDYIPHSVHFNPGTCLFCNWKFVTPNFPHLFCSLLTPAIIYLYLYVSICYAYCFLDSKYKWNFTASVFLWLILLSIITSRSIYVVEMRFHSLLFHCIYTTSSLPIYLSKGP